jgi:hypothetical protein
MSSESSSSRRVAVSLASLDERLRKIEPGFPFWHLGLPTLYSRLSLWDWECSSFRTSTIISEDCRGPNSRNHFRNILQGVPRRFFAPQRATIEKSPEGLPFLNCPAVKNGRCRPHGGLSTGPKTLEGIERIRRAVTKHGRYSKSVREERKHYWNLHYWNLLRSSRQTLADRPKRRQEKREISCYLP